MLEEMKYIDEELLPLLRERKKERESAAKRQLDQWAGKPGVCSLMLSLPAEDNPHLRYLPQYDLEEIHYDVEKMFVSELRSALSVALSKGDGVPSVRANVGCGCVSTLLGGIKQLFFRDKMPWLQERIEPERLMAMTKDDIEESKEFKFGLECMRFMKEKLEGTGIEVYPMDIQGPIDMAHLWLGDDFFYDLYDDPELVHHALQLAVDCDEYAFRKCLEIIQPKGHLAHYNCLVLPLDKPVKISEDTSTLLSQAHIKEYMRPYTEQLLNRLGGGYIHFCGSNPHLLPEVVGFGETVIGLNLGNPERYDFETLLPELIRNKKCYVSTGNGLPNLSESLLRAACGEDGSFHVFLRAECKKDEQQRLLDARDEMIEAILRG